MKFGSIQFYKRLIVAAYLLLILIPLVVAIVLGFLYAKEKARADALQKATLAELTQILQEMEPGADGDSFSDLLVSEQQTPSFPYQVLYPHLYADRPLTQTAEENICYLTFDDGPSELTPELLETLDELNVKATFFVTGENSLENPELLKTIADAGHTIGIHTYSHDYRTIYSSVEAYLADFEQIYSLILNATGTAPEIFRFPGGSVNSYNQPIYIQLVAELSRRGFVYYDWNASAQDAVVGTLSSETVSDNVLASAAEQSRLVVLMHDHADNHSMVEALPIIVDDLREQGFQFNALDNTVESVVFY